MLRSHRAVVIPALRARVSTHALIHERFRLHAVLNERVVCEDLIALRSFDRRGHVGRPIATLLLEGMARVRARNREVWLAPGDVLAMDAKGSLDMRQEGERYAALAFEWDPDWLGPRPEPFVRGRLDASERASCDACFEAVVRGEARAREVTAVVSVLRRAGLELAAIDAAACDAPVPAKTVALSEALDVLFSKLDEQPMLADLEQRTGVSPRQLNRVVAAFNERYGFNAGGWRDARNRRRLFVGIALLTVAGATPQAVAAWVGYRSLSAFTSALTGAGFPPPSSIASLVAALRGPDSDQNRIATSSAAPGPQSTPEPA